MGNIQGTGGDHVGKILGTSGEHMELIPINNLLKKLKHLCAYLYSSENISRIVVHIVISWIIKTHYRENPSPCCRRGEDQAADGYDPDPDRRRSRASGEY